MDKLRPFLPAYIGKEELLIIAVFVAPFILQTTISVIDILSKISLFGLMGGMTSIKYTAKTVKTTGQIATEIFITKPIYILSYPFRKYAQNKQINEQIEMIRKQGS